MSKKANTQPIITPDTTAIRKGIEAFLASKDKKGNKIGLAQYGVYAFFDYYGEPIYVGQTEERIGTRIRRHLTNQRTDAVAMRVLDPQEVAEVEVWPIDMAGKTDKEIKVLLGQCEYTVYKSVLATSRLKAVLNEKDIPVTKIVTLPDSFRSRTVPEPVYSNRKHADIRIARRAGQISELAKIVTERKASKGLRRTLYQQARRLEALAKERFEQIVNSSDPQDEDSAEE